MLTALTVVSPYIRARTSTSSPPAVELDSDATSSSDSTTVTFQCFTNPTFVSLSFYYSPLPTFYKQWTKSGMSREGRYRGMEKLAKIQEKFK